MSTYYALLLPQHIRLTIQQIRRELFAQSGHYSFRALEGAILLGETEDTSLRNNISCPSLPLIVGAKTTYRDSTLLFPIDETQLENIRAELGVHHPYSGIYLGERNIPYEATIPPINNIRLALVEIQQKEGVTLWRTLLEKRLQKGKDL